MTKDHHEKRTGGHRSFSVASLLVLLFVASLVLAVAKSIAGTGFKSIYPLGFVAAFYVLVVPGSHGAPERWPPMTALAIGLHLHPFGCWIVQQKLAEYLESLMALRYALVLVPAILVICISFLIPAAPRSWAARRQCPDRIHLRGTGLALLRHGDLGILFPLDWLSPHWLYFRAPLIEKWECMKRRTSFLVIRSVSLEAPRFALLPWSAMTNELVHFITGLRQCRPFVCIVRSRNGSVNDTPWLTRGSRRTDDAGSD